MESCLRKHKQLDLVDISLSAEKLDGTCAFASVAVWLSKGCDWIGKGAVLKTLRSNFVLSDFQNFGVKFSMEVAPDRKHITSAAGKMFTFLRKRGVDSARIFPEWKSQGVNFYKIDPAAPNVKGILFAAYISERTGWEIFEGAWQDLIPGVTAPEVVAAVRN